MEISKRTAKFFSFSYCISLLMNMPAVIALCLQINLEEMTSATGKREIAKAILPDRTDKQGAQLPVKQAVEAEADFAAPVLPRRARSLRHGRRVRGIRGRSALSAGEMRAGLLLGASTALHRATEKLNPLERERGRSRLLAHRRDAGAAQPGTGQRCGSRSSPEHLPRPAGTSQERLPPGKIKL